MKRLIPTLAMLMLSAASLTTNAKVTEADMLGNAAQPSRRATVGRAAHHRHRQQDEVDHRGA